jgi:hypothetical protein
VEAEVAVLAVEPEAASVVGLEVSEPEVALAAVFAADIGELQVSRGIAVPSVVLIPASGVVVGADSFGRPTFVVFPNGDYCTISATAVEVVDEQSVHSTSCVHTNYGLCNILSIPGLHHNKNLGCFCNESSLCRNTASDTNDLPKGATTSHSRKKGLYRDQEQRKHCRYQAVLSHPVLSEMQRVAAGQYEYLYPPVPWPEEEQQRPMP